MSAKDADVQRIRELIEIMKENDLVKIDIQHGDDRIALRRAEPPPAPATGHIIATVPGTVSAVPGPPGPSVASAPTSGAETEEDCVEIECPMVGTFYEAPSPDSDPYIEIGSHIEPQTVVCIIEAMKVLNEIKAETGGTVVERLVANGQAVEYGQTIFRVKPD